MICKECGAYNPDHATYCKVCAANLKGDTVPEKTEMPEEEQPTKRFSRPSWVVPEQVKEDTSETMKAVEQAAEEIPEATVKVAEPVVEAEPRHEEPVEEDAPEIWAPVPSRRKAAADRIEEPEEESGETLDAENDSIYNDEEALEDEDNSFEYEPTPPKRKQQKKKNNTMFTVLLIAIIVVILAVLVVGGILLFKNRPNCLGSGSDDATKVGTQTDPANNPQNVPSESPSGEPSAAVPDAHNAILKEVVEADGKKYVSIHVVVPAKSKVTFHFPHQDDHVIENTEDKDVEKIRKIAVEAFFKNEPLTESTVEFFPDITLTSPDGTTSKVNCASFKYTFPKLNISVTSPVANEDGMIMAPESNIVTIQGTVDDPTAEVMINNVVTQVYQGGVFMYDYKLRDGIGEDESETVTITATKNDAVTDTKEISIHAYKFIPAKMKLEVRNEGAILAAGKDGKLTITGTTLPGADLKALSDNSTGVLVGSVTVDNDGNFSFLVTMEPGFYGLSVITLTADGKQIGAEDGSTKIRVFRGFADNKAFTSYYKKNYFEIPADLSVSDLLANPSQYSGNTIGIRISAVVGEVVTVDGIQLVKATLMKTNETVYVWNIGGKWEPDKNIGAKYNLYCNFVGTYEDTGCAEFYCLNCRPIKSK